MSSETISNTIKIKIDLRFHIDRPIIPHLTIPSRSRVMDLVSLLEKDYSLTLLSDEARLLPHYLVLVNGKQIELLKGLSTGLRDGDTVAILSAIHGGITGLE